MERKRAAHRVGRPSGVDALPGGRLRGQRRRGGQSGDRVRQRKLQVRHQEPHRSLRRVGPGILDRSLSKRVRKSHRADRGEPTRRPDQLSDFQRRDIADIEWPNAGSQHPAQRRRRHRRAHRTPAARMSARLSRRWAAVRAHENRAKPRCRMAKIQSYWAVRAFWCRFGAAWAGPRDRSREATDAEGETLRHEPEGGAEMQAVAHPPYHPLYKPEYHAIVLNWQNPKLRLAGGPRTRPSERGRSYSGRCYAADVVDLPGLKAFWNEAQAAIGSSSRLDALLSDDLRVSSIELRVPVGMVDMPVRVYEMRNGIGAVIGERLVICTRDALMSASISTLPSGPVSTATLPPDPSSTLMSSRSLWVTIGETAALSLMRLTSPRASATA